MMQNKVSIFIGISQNVYVLTATSDGKNTYQFEPEEVKNKDEYNILINALLKIVRTFKNIEINFYSNNDLFAFEWEKQYKISHDFLKSNKYYKEWHYISKLVENNKISLNIKGENDALTVLNKKIKGEIDEQSKNY